LEIGLFAGIILHMVQGWLLELSNRSARKKGYAVPMGNKGSKWYSRSMGLLGTLLFLFLVMHISHFWVPSRITGHPLIKFNREKPFDATVPYRNDYIAAKTVRKPVAYLVPQAWSRVTERLLLNRIDAFKITKDTMVRLPVLYIRNQETGKTPYEGHFMHTNIKTEPDTQSIQLFAGDYYIPCDQAANRYIIETLEPEATDAFLAWGFFDAIFQQKEWFSDYLFEETALRLLEEKQDLKAEFDSLKNTDAAFTGDPWKMMAWIYRRSPWYEPSHLRYPVVRMEDALPPGLLIRVNYPDMQKPGKQGKMH